MTVNKILSKQISPLKDNECMKRGMKKELCMLSTLFFAKHN